MSSDAHVDELLRGAVDLSCYSGPSPADRRLDHFEVAREAEAAGMRAIVYKDHWYSVTPVATCLRATYLKDSKLAVHSGVVLNNTVGGLNCYAVEHSLMMGGRIVWMPTLSASNHIRQSYRDTHRVTRQPMKAPTSLNVLTPRWFVKDEVKEILDQIAKFDAVLAAGHLHISEVLPLFEEAKRRGITRLLVSHPQTYVDALSSELKILAEMGAYIELGACDGSATPPPSAAELKATIDVIGLDKSILGFGRGTQSGADMLADARATIRIGLDLGYAPPDVRQMVSLNPSRLLGIDGDRSR
jgi:hypothetical protein